MSSPTIPCEVRESAKAPWKYEIVDPDGVIRGFFMTKKSACNTARELMTLGYVEDSY